MLKGLHRPGADFKVVTLKKMPIQRHVPGMCVHKNHYVVVCGGTVNESNIKRVDYINVRTNTWGRLPDMNLGRYMPQIISIKDKLFVFFGYSGGKLGGTKVENSIEILGTNDSGEAKWNRVEFSA